MAQRTEMFDLSTLGLSSGEGQRLELAVPVDGIAFAGREYAPGGEAEVLLNVSRTTGEGYALRLMLDFELSGPCMRCLEPATHEVRIDVREVEQADAEDDELKSPYLEGEELDMAGWVRDSIALAVPAQILCREACRGLCPECGVDLNESPEHGHEPVPDPRWAKLSELKLD